MDVRLPDGTVIRNVPDGTTKAQLVAKLSANGYDMSGWGAAPAAPEAPKQEPSLIDAPNAAATGFNRSVLRLAGMPVDTVANVIDLGKAAVGAPYTAFTGKPAPDFLQPTPREQVVGSGEYLVSKARETAPGAAVLNPINPEYEGGYIQNAGGGLAAVINPQTRAQAVNQALLGVTSVTGAKAVGDKTGNPALAATASMLPLAAQTALTAATKGAVRGGEQGRREMEQRIQDLKAAGVDEPTLGLASGNQLLGGVENLLQSTPGAVKIMRTARERAIAGLEGRAGEAAAGASSRRGALEAGTGIETGLKGFKDDFKARQNALYNALEQKIGRQHPTDVTRTRNALSVLNEDIPTMPELSKQFKNARIQAIEEALTADMAGKPGAPAQTINIVPGSKGGHGRPAVAPVSILGPDGQPLIVAPAGAAIPSRKAIPFEAVKKTRTLVGGEIADNALMSDVPRSKWNPLYGALSDDMQATAAAAGPQATGAFNRASGHTRAGMERLERVAPFANKNAPEQAYTSLANTLQENVSTFQAVKKSLPEGARGQVAGTVIERLGKARSGVQNDAGDAWSPDTFLTNWNRMTPKARDELLSGFPNAAQVKSDIQAVAKATSMMREGSKLWANPSGTGANVMARGVLGAVGAGGAGAAAGLVSPLIPIGAALGIAGTNMLARAVTSGKVRDAMARRTDIDPELLKALIAAQVGGNALSRE